MNAAAGPQTSGAAAFGSEGAVLDVEDLRVRVRSRSGARTVVDGITYAVRPSEFVAVVGESGAGKSVSVRAALGLLDRERFEVAGRVRLGGVELSALAGRARRRHVATSASLVFQDPSRALNPTMRVGWQIAEAMYKSPDRKRRLAKREALRRSVELMRDVGIADPEERFSSYPHQLSGGMKQRIVIATALSCRPRVVICDEPTSSLDVTTQAVIMDVLDDLRRRLGLAIVLITHDLALANSRAERVMVMHRGRLVEELPTGNLAERAAMPYTRALLQALPDPELGGLPQPIRAASVATPAVLAGCSFQPFCEQAQDVCARDVPGLEELGDGHRCRCFFPVVAGGQAEKVWR